MRAPLRPAKRFPSVEEFTNFVPTVYSHNSYWRRIFPGPKTNVLLNEDGSQLPLVRASLCESFVLPITIVVREKLHRYVIPASDRLSESHLAVG
jgi:hypothetical protein